MKKRKIFFVLLCSVLIILIGCSKKNNDNSNDFLTKYTDKYKIKQENEDGTIEIGVIAPDFETIINNAVKNKQDNEINIENINNLINKYPDYEKEYVIIISDLSDKEEIKAVFNDKIAEELIKSAIINIVYEEEWSAEE